MNKVLGVRIKDEKMAIKVLVADDHAMVRSGISALLKGSGITVIDEATDGEEAVEKTIKLKPDVLLMDIRMPKRDGFAALEKIRKKLPNQRVVMLSAFDNNTYVARSVALGADDYILKDSPKDEMVAAIQRVYRDEDLSDSSILRRVKRVMNRKKEEGDDGVPLTNRELQVLRHVALGLSNREIGGSLGISIETVKEHVQNILRKLDVNDRTQAAVWAVKKGVV
jgi:DNA-binding NarL/FixJ family response regulator